MQPIIHKIVLNKILLNKTPLYQILIVLSRIHQIIMEPNQIIGHKITKLLMEPNRTVPMQIAHRIKLMQPRVFIFFIFLG